MIINSFEAYLDYCCEILSEAQFPASVGRSGSAKIENLAFKLLRANNVEFFDLDKLFNNLDSKKDKRYFCDFIIIFNKKLYFINHKSTVGRKDDMGSKVSRVICYSKIPKFSSNEELIKFYNTFNNMGEVECRKYLVDNLSLTDNGQDYYFLVHNKKNLRYGWTSLKSLTSVAINADNGLQVQWFKNDPKYAEPYEKNMRFVLRAETQCRELLYERTKDTMVYDKQLEIKLA